MLSYELCKQLRDAGFPSGNKGFFINENEVVFKPHERSDAINEFGEWCFLNFKHCYVPTLAELIRACGDDFLYLSSCFRKEERIIKWVAGSFGLHPKYNGQQQADGESPEEAVANLYLTLAK